MQDIGMQIRYSAYSVLFFAAAASAAQPPKYVSFSKDVAPILQNHCQTCRWR